MILITGANGQLGNELRSLAATYPQWTFHFTDIAELDITDAQAVNRYVEEHSIRYALNCAAYTAVDKAESDAEVCFRVNRDAVAVLSDALNRVGGTLLQVSTDYVFNGRSFRPYVEEDAVSPTSVYGASKLEGEQHALRHAQHIVLRTSWLYSSFGNNFVKAMLRLGREREALTVVFDQVGTPTYAADLAAAMLAIVHWLEQHPAQMVGGVYHYSNEGVCSWYDFTKSIHRMSQITGCRVSPIEGASYPTAATRPHFSVLNKTKIKNTFALAIPHWEESLQRCVALLEKTK